MALWTLVIETNNHVSIICVLCLIRDPTEIEVMPLMHFTVIAAVCHVDEQKCGAIIPLFCATVFHCQAHNSLRGFGGKQKSQVIEKIIFPNIILVYKLIKDILVWSSCFELTIVASKHKDLWFPRRLSLQGWKNTILESRQCLQFNCGTITHAPEARDAVTLHSAQEGHY